jgi:hypothetical protein
MRQGLWNFTAGLKDALWEAAQHVWWQLQLTLLPEHELAWTDALSFASSCARQQAHDAAARGNTSGHPQVRGRSTMPG